MALALNSQNSQFVFFLPGDYVPNDIQIKYQDYLTYNHSQYNTILDFLNSTIEGITFPSINIPTVTQKKYYGKDVQWRGAISPHDIFDRDLQITIKSVSNHFNYFIFQDLTIWHYINTVKPFVEPFRILMLDKDQRAVYEYTFTDITITKLSTFDFGYGDTDQSHKTFQLGFHYNFFDLKYLDPRQLPDLTKTPL